MSEKILNFSEKSLVHLGSEVEWRIEDNPVPYEDSIHFMETCVDEIRNNNRPETVWLLEHPALYTAGTSAKDEDLLMPGRFPVFNTGRGGQYTYHGPGQRIIYVMLDLKKRDQDVRKFINDLEQWIIQCLSEFNIIAERRQGRVGLWVPQGSPSNPAYREDKIAAIGVRIRRWVTFHGISINVDPDLSHFEGIVPCGIKEYGVTSLFELGNMASMSEVDSTLRSSFEQTFQRRTVA